MRCLILVLLLAAWSAVPVAAAEDPVWSATEWAQARRFSPLPPPPPDLTNALADHLPAAHLGHKLFFETRLSPRGIACATCHLPELGFTDGMPLSQVIAPLRRHTMTILNAGHYRWLMWDGARDSLWSQALGPFEQAMEMASSRLFVVQAAMQLYGAELRSVATLPAGWEALWPTLPTSGQPGDASFDMLPPAHQEAVNQVFASIGRVIAAYERHINSAAAPFDRFVAGDSQAMSLAAQRGFQHFLRFQCNTCHTTPLFSDEEFHNLGLAVAAAPDQGRAEGLLTLQQSPFRGTGKYADGEPSVRAEDYRPGKTLLGTFRTPSLRELQHTAPYGHNGAFATLDAWMEHYEDVTALPSGHFLGTLSPSLPTVHFTPAEQQELVEFLLSLSSTPTDLQTTWTRRPTMLP